jgi:hypothetical protein
MPRFRRAAAKPGLGAHGAAQVLFAFLRQTEVLELHITQVGERRRVLRLQVAPRAPVDRGGFVRAALQVERAQVEMGFREIGAVSERQRVAVRGIRVLASRWQERPRFRWASASSLRSSTQRSNCCAASW